MKAKILLAGNTGGLSGGYRIQIMKYRKRYRYQVLGDLPEQPIFKYSLIINKLSKKN